MTPARESSRVSEPSSTETSRKEVGAVGLRAGSTYPLMPAEYRPTTDDVAAFMRSRTQGRFDEEGVFNENTRPTKDQVEKEITDAVNEVSGAISDLDQDPAAYPCVVRMRERAKSAVIIYTAMLIELGYFPEQTSGAFSPYDRLEKLYTNKMKTLTEAVGECIGGGGESVGGDGTGMPSGCFGNLEGVAERDW